MQYSIFEEATGKILMAMEVPTIEAAMDNVQDGQLLIEGWYDGATHYVTPDDEPALRPTIPQPVEDGNFRRWPDPPPGLTARVFDLWIDPPHLLVDTPLTAPDCGLHLAQGGAGYRIDLTADFPWLPLTVEVAP